MPFPPELLVLTGALCLVASLVLAWCLSGIRYLQLAPLKKLFPNYAYLLRSHIDFLMMTGLLFATYLLLVQFNVGAPAVVVAAVCIGSVLNPAGLLALAVKPDLPQTPLSVFGVIGTGGFVATTFGYGGAAWYIFQAALPIS